MAWPRELGVSDQPVDRAFEIAAVRDDGAGDEKQHFARNLQRGMREFCRRQPRFQNLEPQRLVERPHLHADAAGQPRAHALVDGVELGGRTVGGDHHLAPRVDQAN